MKKVGIITIHKSPNYGGSLQSFALWKYISDQGIDCSIIDLYRPANIGYIYSLKYRSFIHKWSPINRIKASVQQFLFLLKNWKVKQKGKEDSFYNSISKKKFEEFNSQISFSKPYNCIDELYKNPPHYDLYITGSDQVWNPTQPYPLEPYFLTFAKGKKISYASSIGVTDLTNKEKRCFKKWLEQYDSVSVREKTAKTLLESFVNKEISVVSDPTFLLDIDYWKSIAVTPSIAKPYILVFTLHYQPHIVSYSRKLAEESGMELVVLGQKQPVEAEGYIAETSAGPNEFLGYINNASLVITDSFHCTLFSFILGAGNVFTYIDSTNKRGSRIFDLYSLFGIEGHILSTSLNQNYAHLISKPIDRNSIVDIFKKNQRESREFLNRYL